MHLWSLAALMVVACWPPSTIVAAPGTSTPPRLKGRAHPTAPKKAALTAHRGAVGVISQRVKDLVANMSLEDKVGQMGELDLANAINWGDVTVDQEKIRYYIKNYRLGSFLNTPLAGGGSRPIFIWDAAQWRQAMKAIQEVAEEEGVLPLIHGLDSVHGANYVKGATMFPQQHGLGATFQPAFAKSMGEITAKDTMAGGVQWIYGPILDIGMQPRWSRMYETFSEDPYLVSVMGAAVIEGIQGFSYDNFTSAACMKHFIAYGGSTTGLDQSPVELDYRTILNYYLPPYRAAVKAGVKTAMESYNEISGVPVVSSPELLKTLLRGELGFQGMLVTDYGEISALHGDHAIAATNKEGVRIAMEDTSIDMSMIAWSVDFMDDLKALVKEGAVPMERIDESVTRLLVLKEDLGLLDRPYGLLGDDNMLDATVGSDKDKAIALAAIRESVTLLKNDNSLLPLAKGKPHNILVAGPTGDSLTFQSGGWTIHWPGAAGDHEFTYGTTVFQGIKDMAAKGSVVDFVAGVDIEGKWVDEKNELIDRASHADVIVACVGEAAYAEGFGNIPDLVLPKGQEEMVVALASTGVPVIVILLEGRPRLLGEIPEVATAILHGYLPGPLGGIGISEILFGVVNPSGRLTQTYPKYQNTPLAYYHKIRQKNYEEIQWPFGAGLSYTSWSYKNVKVSPAQGDENTPIEVSLTVGNEGEHEGRHTVMVFVSDVVRRVTPEVKLLKAFTKVSLKPGETADVKFTLHPLEDFAYYGLNRRRLVESGDFLIGIGPEVDCRKSADQCATFTLKTSARYSPVCQSACEAWMRLGTVCSNRGVNPPSDVARLKDAKTCHSQCQSDKDWSWDYVDCLEARVVDGQCLKVKSKCRDVTAAH